MKDQKINKGGRKRLNIDLDEVERLAGLGLSEKQIADNLGVSWHTLHRNKLRSASFASRIEAGKSKAISEVANSLFRSATKEDPNIHAVKFFLSNRGEQGQWAEKDLSLNVDLNLNTVLKDARARIIDLPGSNNNKSLDPVTIPDSALPGSKAKDQGSKQPGGLPKKNYALPGTSKIQDHNGPQNKKTALARDPNEIINGSDPAREPNE